MNRDKIFKKYEEFLIQYSRLLDKNDTINTSYAIALLHEALRELHEQYNDELLEMGKRHKEIIEIIFDKIEEYKTDNNVIIMNEKDFETIKRKVQ